MVLDWTTSLNHATCENVLPNDALKGSDRAAKQVLRPSMLYADCIASCGYRCNTSKPPLEPHMVWFREAVLPPLFYFCGMRASQRVTCRNYWMLTQSCLNAHCRCRFLCCLLPPRLSACSLHCPTTRNSETWESSILLLFETLPWLGPSSDFFPLPKPEHRSEDPGVQVLPDAGSRHNTGARHEEGIKHITPDLREAASRANQVDEALHEFVSAKFCDRLRETGLLDHPLVASELATYELLDQRCNDASWASDTLKRYEPITPASCRLYRPVAKPQIP
ncbi:unnamed protein product [Scytosiphon promiscuus]